MSTVQIYEWYMKLGVEVQNWCQRFSSFHELIGIYTPPFDVWIELQRMQM